MKLDHAVWFTRRTPDEVAGQYEGAFVGGRHEQWGTYNALKYLQNGYMEWLAVEDAALARQSDHPLIRQLVHDLDRYGDGWGTLCVSTDQIDELNDRLGKMGWKTSGILDASRLTASGRLKKWKMLFVDETYGDQLPYPFFIQWEEDETTRLEVLREEGAIGELSESEQIMECVLAAGEPAAVLSKWCALLDVEPAADDSFLLGGIRFRFADAAGERPRMIAVITGQTET